MKANAERLRKQAATLRLQAAGKRDSGTHHQNYTRRRAVTMASQEHDAEQLEELAGIMGRLAEIWDDGQVPLLLRGLKTRAVIENVRDWAWWPTSSWAEDVRVRLEKAGISPENYERTRAALLALAPGRDIGERQRCERERFIRGLVGCIPGFFPTPPAVCNQMVNLADLRDGQILLEPSAGAGNLADACLVAATVSMTLVEVNYELAAFLRDKGYQDVQECDFLSWQGGPFERIVMNPPFESNQDMTHIRHAYDLLRPGGRLVSVIGEGPFFRANGGAPEFRLWLDELGAEIHDLPAGAFTSSGTGVKARIIVLDKPGEYRRGQLDLPWDIAS
jgi:hypothetical protein